MVPFSANASPSIIVTPTDTTTRLTRSPETILLVSVINGTTNTVTATIGVGSDPVAVGVNPTTNCICMANSWDGAVSVIAG